MSMFNYKRSANEELEKKLINMENHTTTITSEDFIGFNANVKFACSLGLINAERARELLRRVKELERIKKQDELRKRDCEINSDGYTNSVEAEYLYSMEEIKRAIEDERKNQNSNLETNNEFTYNSKETQEQEYEPYLVH